MTLRVDGIEFGYSARSTIRDVTFDVDAGDMLTIMGPNGVGKTTLLKCFNRILEPRRGSVWIDGDNVRAMSRAGIAKRIGYVAQRGEVSRLTVYDLILLGRRSRSRWGMNDRDHAATTRVIELLGLSGLALRYADEISGGEFQLAQVARALAQEPRVIVLDEPTSSLDINNQHQLLSMLERIVVSSAMSSIMTNHDINLSIRYSNKLLLMKDGTIFAAGGREIVTPESIRAVYGIDVHVGTLHGIPFVLPK